LIVMALGAAAELVKYSSMDALDDERTSFDTRQQQSELSTMASVCFDEALKLLGIAYMEVSTVSAQCIFLAGYIFSRVIGLKLLIYMQYILLVSSKTSTDVELS
jgi:hypothetical protein